MSPASLSTIVSGCLMAIALLAGRGDVTSTLAIVDVWIWDADRPAGSAGTTVLVREGRIVAVGPASEVAIPAGAKVVDGASLHLIPGLWDLHVHALWEEGVPETFLPLFVAHGVTGVRDMGGTLEILEHARAELASGGITGPRLVAAGMIVDGPAPVHPEVSIAVETAAEGRAAVARLAAAGVDFIKVYTLLPEPAFAAIVAAAAERSLPVAGHVPAEAGPVAAADAGLVTIEHLMSELGGFCDPADEAACAPIFDAFRRNGTRMVPALVMERELEREAMARDPRVRYLAPPVVAYWFEGLPIDPDPAGAPHAVVAPPAMTRLAAALHRAGVPLLAGTDAGVPFSFPGSSLHEELELLVAAGLTPAEALTAATRDAARTLGFADLGTIAPGQRADLVLLRASPLEDIRNTREIEAVIRDGELLDRQELDRILEEVATRAGRMEPRAPAN